MKSCLLLISILTILATSVLHNEIIIADDADVKTEKTKEKKQKKEQEVFNIEGTIEKSENFFYLKTANERLKLPEPKEKDSKIKLDDFVGKNVKINAKGYVYQNKDNNEKDSKPKEGEREKKPTNTYYIKSIQDVSVVEKEEPKKDEKK